ncbi:polyphosphate kinase 1 [Candidatus Epulonipiscium viviparus]|uniref:polyphosphate kinase 1 n=1 Tax=Candidatus Epulonipiscium viviparus TaxID=420336 RepID=UPI0005C711DB|nr:polyphosphate kinase 1 [Candidatus Epulopiscium viviparus]
MTRNYMQNRELSWLNFNDRVLDEADDKTVPIGERLKFISIFSNNLDEFVMIRVGGLFDQLITDANKKDKTGMTAEDQLNAIYLKLGYLYKKRDSIYRDVNTQLKDYSIHGLEIKDLNKEEMEIVKAYFNEHLTPILSPAIVSKHSPFPQLYNNMQAIILRLQKENKIKHGIITFPSNYPKIIYLNPEKTRYILTEYVILKFAHKLFKKFTMLDSSIIRLTRNADINLDEEINDEDEDYVDHIKSLLRKRGRLAPVRLELSNDLEKETMKLLKKSLKLPEKYFLITSSPMDFSYVSDLFKMLPKDIVEKITYKKISAQLSPSIDINQSIMKQIRDQDLLLSYPYESIMPFLKLLKEAASDPKVISIKITIYRMAPKTRIVDYLCRAAENGKSVFVIMELRARFDESNNINWFEKLKEAGCTVIFGLEYFKVHSKVCLISFMEDSGEITYISQIGTGNYNEVTAKVYTDLSLMTADQNIGQDIDSFFKNIPTENLNGTYKCIVVSPFAFKNKLILLIDREIEKQHQTQNGRIIMKMNSLTESDIIDALVKASRAGVKIDLIIRGISCLLPNIKDSSENIYITSIVGRFLEHSRLYVFGQPDDMQIYISSADCMPRNLEKRVEVAAPIYDSKIKNHIYETLEVMLKDNTKARFMTSAGEYVRKEFDDAMDSQIYFINEAYKNAGQELPY